MVSNRIITCSSTLDSGARAVITLLTVHDKKGQKHQKHTTPRIRWSSPTQLLVQLSVVYLGESGRDPELSTAYGRMCLFVNVVGHKKGKIACGKGAKRDNPTPPEPLNPMNTHSLHMEHRYYITGHLAPKLERGQTGRGQRLNSTPSNHLQPSMTQRVTSPPSTMSTIRTWPTK